MTRPARWFQCPPACLAESAKTRPRCSEPRRRGVHIAADERTRALVVVPVPTCLSPPAAAPSRRQRANAREAIPRKSRLEAIEHPRVFVPMVGALDSLGTARSPPGEVGAPQIVRRAARVPARTHARCSSAADAVARRKEDTWVERITFSVGIAGAA